jgi:phosphate transport system substrate-binding protein
LESYYPESDRDRIKVLAFEGVTPSKETIASGEYALATNYFAVIRKDTPQDHSARKIIDWLVSPAGQDIVHESQLGRIN